MNQSFHRTCYFFRNSGFHRHAAVLDEAVAAHLSGTSITAMLCLNPLVTQPCGAQVVGRGKYIWKWHRRPCGTGAEGEAFVLDADIDRNDESALLAYLQQKYATAPLMKFDMGYLSVAARSPD
ncbi:hypothetical protein [Acidovorax sp. SDU_ACID1]|uniref:hypothetical protein n=1 Tax=Acidovorax sp. SDU_ACID1 TaxID=3136632 RepID=UPI003873017B